MEQEIIAKAKSTNLPVSLKQIMEICNSIRGKSVKYALKFLDEVLAFKRAVPYRRFKMNIPHQKSHTGPGRYPIKAARFMRTVVNSALKNAINKGMKEDVLFIKYAIANKGATVWHPGRHARRQMKRTHIEIILAEKQQNQKKTEARQSKPIEKAGAKQQ